MRRISISELQNNPSKILEDLPVEIIRYGQTVGYIVEPGKSFDYFAATSGTEAQALIETEAAVEESFLPEYTWGYCTKCHKKAEVKSVEYSDSDGSEYKETLCKAHYTKLQNFIKK